MIFSNCRLKAPLAPGFTLVELMVTLAILAVISLGVFVQFRNLSPTQTLENGSDLFRSVFVDLRTGVLAHQKCCGDLIPEAYGLSVTLDGRPDNTVLLFADLDGDLVYSSDYDELISTTVLPDNVNIKQCSTTTTTISSGICTVAITTGSNSGLYYNGFDTTDTITFTLVETTASTSTTLNIYPTGFVIE